LSARALFGEDKFPALKISPALTQEESDLERKGDVAVQVLVQTVKITDAVFQ
jgi:hypothetical protein